MVYTFSMQLVTPTKKFEKSWRAAVKEFNAEGKNGSWNNHGVPIDMDSYVQQCENYSQGKNLPEGKVPATTYWLIDEKELVGVVNIRHELTDHLRKIGGHIGYAIRPSARKRGYGTRILELALLKAKQIGITKALVTCDESNIGSQKIIEKNGGIFEDKVMSDGEYKLRYWIKI